MEEKLGMARVGEGKKNERFDGGVPPGYKFCPTDAELIVYYLKRKNLGQPLPPNIIGEIELYNHSSDELVRLYLTMHGTERDADYSMSRKRKECYFFTSRDKKYRKGERPRRDAGNGLWKATGADNPIIDMNGVDTGGVKKTLVYYIGNHKASDKSNWIMHEYRLEKTPETMVRNDGNMRLDGWVLCRIYEKNEKKDSSDNLCWGQKGEPDIRINNLNEIKDEEVNAVISNEPQSTEASPTISNNKGNFHDWLVRTNAAISIEDGGQHPKNEPRFIKNFNNWLDRSYAAISTEDGGEHLKSGLRLMTAYANPISALASSSCQPEVNPTASNNNENFENGLVESYAAISTEDGGEHLKSKPGLMTADVNPISTIASSSYQPECLNQYYVPFEGLLAEEYEYFHYLIHSFP
ncbi:NAC domain-containing protein 2-like [Magnolia sinica]|uniref:NAC domain-containing protein 2-like n=1 Tax=Magnolia sinica TaxID=86752 RepID=UPI002659D7E5|nr:NAC domain-containing protein 2-like [Magnolia sinica]